MALTKAEKLARIKGYSTDYEIVIENPGAGLKALLCYGRKSRTGMAAYLRKYGPKVVKAIGGDDATGFRYRRGHLEIDGGWIVKPSGRTHREAIIEGDLPWIVSIAEGDKNFAGPPPAPVERKPELLLF